MKLQVLLAIRLSFRVEKKFPYLSSQALRFIELDLLFLLSLEWMVIFLVSL